MLNPHSLSKRISLCLVLSILASFAVCANAKSTDNWYEIEIIVFSQQMEGNFEIENWQTKPGYPVLNNVTELYSPSEILLEDSLENLPEYLTDADIDPDDEATLANYASRLKNSSKYRLLIHRAWRQLLDDKKVYLIDNPDTDPVVASESTEGNQNEFETEKSAEDLLMQALLTEEKNFSEPLTRLPFFISELDSIQPFDEVRDIPSAQYTPLSYEGPPQHLIYGYFQLSKGRHLHMDLDFLYRGEPYTPAAKELSIDETFPMAKQREGEGEGEVQEAQEISAQKLAPLKTLETTEAKETTAETTKTTEAIATTEIPGFVSIENTPLVGFRIVDSKRVRLNNVYYFDHPLFGIIARVNSYTPPPEEKEDDKEEDKKSVISSEKLN